MGNLSSKLKEHASLIFVLLIMALLISIVTIFMVTQKSTELNVSNAQIETLKRDLTARESDIETLNNTKEDLIAQIAKSAVEQNDALATQAEIIKTLESRLKKSFELPDYVVDSLAKHGYKTPLALLETLSQNDKLIPAESVLGGTMRWVTESSAILTDQYAFGYFEDGHILGYAFLQYTFNEDNSVAWRVLNYYMD